MTLDIFKDSLISRLKLNDFYIENAINFKPTTTGLSISFFNEVIFKLINSKSKTKVDISENILNILSIGFEKAKSGWASFDFNDSISEKIIQKIDQIYEKIYDEAPAERFSCCANYLECSNANICIYKNKEFGRGCKYNKNLREGKIFYGVNKTL